MSNNVSVNSSVLGVFACRLLLFCKSVRIVVLFINLKQNKTKQKNTDIVELKNMCNGFQTTCKVLS